MQQELKEDGLNWKQRGWRRNYEALSDGDRLSMLVDETFALYLNKVSQRLNANFYKTVVAFVIHFRECLNEIGWQKRLESEEISLDERPEIAEQMRSKQFCLFNTAEHAPEICNEFVTVFME